MPTDDTPPTTIERGARSAPADAASTPTDVPSPTEGAPATSGSAPATDGATSGSESPVAQPTELTLAYATEPFPEASFDVKQRDEAQLLGTDVTLTVIGSSHYVAAPGLGTYELFSCSSIDGDHGTAVSLEHGVERSVRYETDAVAIETVVEARPLGAFPGPEPFDVAYEFGPRAYTTIDCSRDGYETYHTYPEFELAIYTQSTYEERSSREERSNCEERSSREERSSDADERQSDAAAEANAVATRTEVDRQ